MDDTGPRWARRISVLTGRWASRPGLARPSSASELIEPQLLRSFYSQSAFLKPNVLAFSETPRLM